MANLLAEIALSTEGLAKAMSRSSEMTSETLLASMVAILLGHAQRIFEKLRPDDQFVVCLKTADPQDPTRLACHHLFDRMPPERQKNLLELGLPKSIPLDGTLVGSVVKTGRPVIVRDVREGRGGFSDDAWASMHGQIRSMVAWPIRLNGDVVAVLVVDSNRTAVFDPADNTLIQVVRFAAAQFELAFGIFFLGRSRGQAVRDQEAAESFSEPGG